MKSLRVCSVLLLLGVMLVISGCQSVPPAPPTITPTLAPVSPTTTPSLSVAVSRTSVPLLKDWRFAVDRDKVGEQQGWIDPTYDDSKWVTVTVPHTWNVMSEYADYSGLAWYRHTFTPTVESGPAHLRLHFEAVFYLARVWLNGQYLGEHEGGYTPFEIDVTCP